MTHLSAAELKTWYEQGSATDRGRVLTHLAECDECRRALSVMAMQAADEVAAPALTAADAVPRGYAAHAPQPAAAGGWLSWLRPAYALVAAAVVVVAVMWVTVPKTDEGGDAVRSSELVALAPGGSTSLLEFTWESPFDASRYRLVIRDAAGAQVFSSETTESSINIDAIARGRFATMVEYSWVVIALDASGEAIAESKPRSFTYQP